MICFNSGQTLSRVKSMSKEEVKALFEAYAREEGFAEVYLVGDKLVAGHHTEIGYQLLISPAGQELLEKAQSDHAAFQLVKTGAQFALRHNKELPANVNAFIADMMDSSFRSPTKPRGKKEDIDFYWTLRLALCKLSECGYRPTRNDERTKSSSPCGIDIVLEVLHELNMGQDRDYQSLKKIWIRGNKKYGKPMRGT